VSSRVLRSCALAAAAVVEASRDELCRLDAAAGDGDHGVTMALAARAVRRAIADSPDATDTELVTKIALAIGSVGGACGPIYASGLLAIATAMRGIPEGPLTVALVLDFAEAAENAITSLGQARPGDKTILDALDPAVRALREAQSSGRSVGEGLIAAAAAAREGAAATAAMIASAGRASRLGERSRGLADPGASSLALILGALASNYVREITSPRGGEGGAKRRMGRPDPASN
jgi:phosphoenolpyruvate---glycerone phosphotransferase subunit DhaL